MVRRGQSATTARTESHSKIILRELSKLGLRFGAVLTVEESIGVKRPIFMGSSRSITTLVVRCRIVDSESHKPVVWQRYMLLKTDSG